MKILSDSVVSKQDLTDIDLKQTSQIKQLRVWLVASFVVNIIVSIGIFLALRY